MRIIVFVLTLPLWLAATAAMLAALVVRAIVVFVQVGWHTADDVIDWVFDVR